MLSVKVFLSKANVMMSVMNLLYIKILVRTLYKPAWKAPFACKAVTFGSKKTFTEPARVIVNLVTNGHVTHAFKMVMG